MQNEVYSNYQRIDIEAASKGKVVLLLFDGTIKFLKIAIKAIEENEIETAHNNIIKAENIIYELMSTLNMDAGELSENLMKLYDFMIWKLIEANKEKSIDMINIVLNTLYPIRDAWKVVVENESKLNKGEEKKEVKSLNIAG